MSKLPTVPDSHYHVVMDNFFTSPSLLLLLVQYELTEPKKHISDDMKKQERGISNVINDKKSNVTLVRWKDNKVVTVASRLYGKNPMKRARRYIKDQGGRVEIDQPNTISFYSKTMGGVNRMDQNIGAYLIKYVPFSFVAYNL